jgi:hypothetical protein
MSNIKTPAPIKSKSYIPYWESGYRDPSRSKLGNSSFWMDDSFTDKALSQESGVDYIKLSGYKRAISNFVKIVTNKSIPVHFAESGNSYTDGQKVIISAKLSSKEFDPTVGLALHEGSHIALTDFNYSRKIFAYVGFPVLDTESKIWDDFYIWYNNNVWDHKTFTFSDHKSETMGNIAVMNNFISNAHPKMSTRIKDLINIIEDRRIDRFVYDAAPGYRGYYHSLYEKYFNAKEIDLALTNGVWTDQTDWDHYTSHICNFTNSKRQLDQLPGLRKIFQLIDIGNINRLTSTKEVTELAFEVARIIAENVGSEFDASGKSQKPTMPGKNSKPMSGPGEGGADDDGTSAKGTSSDDVNSQFNPEDLNPGDTNNDAKDNDDVEDIDDAEVNEAPAAAKLTEKQMKALAAALQAQKDFLNGNVKKGKMSKKDASSINALADANIDFVDVGGDIVQGQYRASKTKCIVLRGFDANMINSGVLSSQYTDPEAAKAYMERRRKNYGVTDYVQEGFQLGTMLGKKLKTRDEERSIKTTRLDTGRIDRRLVAELGFGNDRVFANTLHNTITPAHVHVSIDASGSMSGSKWDAALKTAIAIAKAASSISSLDCVISIRGQLSSAGQSPLMWIVYDSRKDNLSAIKHHFYGLEAGGSTPEGLCFESIQKQLLKDSQGRDMYFINISDGEPCYSNSDLQYYGPQAEAHTKAQVDKLRGAGIKVLSYFVSDHDVNSGSEPRSMPAFKRMYGKDSVCIDVNNLTELSKSLNHLFERTA